MQHKVINFLNHQLSGISFYSFIELLVEMILCPNDNPDPKQIQNISVANVTVADTSVVHYKSKLASNGQNANVVQG